MRYGYRKIRVLLNREGWKWGNTWWNGSTGEKDNAAAAAETTPTSSGTPARAFPSYEAEPCVVDGLCGGSVGGRKKISVVDGGGYLHAECLAIESEQRLKGEDVVRVLNRIKNIRGVPKMMHWDIGSEFSSQVMDLWAYQNEVRMAFSALGNQLITPSWNRSTARFERNA